MLICTGDRDAFQLVSDNVTVLYPRKGVSDLARMTPEAVEEKYFATPARYPDLAALVGESSDNLPGVPGVGPKTAAKWLETYDGLENLVAHAGELKGKAAEAFQERIDDVLRNRQINALVRRPRSAARGRTTCCAGRGTGRRPTSSSTGWSSGCCGTGCWRPAQRGRDRPEGGFELSARRSWSRASWRPGWTSTRSASAPAWTSSATGAPARGDVTRPRAGRRRRCGRVRRRAPSCDPDDENALVGWLADPERHKAMHDAKGPLLALWARGWELAGLTSDTQLAAYLARPDQRTFDLADLTIRYLKRELKVEAGAGAHRLRPAGPGLRRRRLRRQVAAEAAMVRARAVIDLADALDAEIEERNGTSLLYGVELPLLRTLARMEQTGVAVDVDHLEALESSSAPRSTRPRPSAYEVLGKQINLGSPKQLQVVLFDELEMPKTRRTKTGYTTDAEALQGLYVKTEHPFLAHLLMHRDAIRLKQTVEGLLKSVADDGRIHTTYVQTIAATGRLSSTDPNLQNIPIRTEEGRRIRQAFVVGRGLRVADVGRLLPDRDADHGARQRGRRA